MNKLNDIEKHAQKQNESKLIKGLNVLIENLLYD